MAETINITDANEAILLAIQNELVKQDRTLAWLSRKTGIPYPTLYSIFIHKTFALGDRLQDINEALGTDIK